MSYEKTKFSNNLVIFSLLLIWILPLKAQEIGKYAILIFGGKSGIPKIITPDSAYVKYEMSKIFDVLINDYEYENDDIYVHNLSGYKTNPEDYYSYFQQYAEVNKYRSPTYYQIRMTFHDINNDIWSHWSEHENNIVFIFISGHKGKEPERDSELNYTKHFYHFYSPTSNQTDGTFANWIHDELLVYNNHNIKSKTRLIFVTGFCSSFGFWDDSPDYDELKDVSTFITMTVADSAKGYRSNIAAAESNSFMYFYANELSEEIGISLNTALNRARTTLLDSMGWDNPSENDTSDWPHIVCEGDGNNWHNSWNLYDGNLSPATPQNLSVSASQNDHPLLTWDANDEADLKQYNIYKMNHESEFVLYDETTTNSFEDTEEEIGGSPFQHSVYYKVTALDLTLNESDYSNQAGISVDGIPPYSFGNTPNTDSIKHYFLPWQYSLSQNFPNPFNPITKITFDLPQDSNIEINVYNINGEKIFEIFNGYKTAGSHSVFFDASNLSSGLYLYSIKAGSFRQVRKMMCIK